MLAIHPAKAGCFKANFQDKAWVEVKCLPPPETPNPHHEGPRPNTVGDGNDYFAVVTSGTISQVTGSFDRVSGVDKLLGPILGKTSVVHPDVYAIQMNSNTYTASVCGSLKNCAWVQFIFSQTQCGSSPCVFIEYWLLNHDKHCPSTPAGSPAWKYSSGGKGTPGCYLNAYGNGMSAVPLSDLKSLRVIGKTQGGHDIATASDASGALSSVSNPSIADLSSKWTGVEYNLVGDCCNTETFFTSTTNASLTLRVAPVNGTKDAPACAPTKYFAGGTAETNNLNLTSGCKTSGGSAPAIVFTESGGGSLPPGVSIGDPHLTTFHGAHYNYQHAGEYILAEADPDFQVQVRQVLITPPTKPAIAVNTGAAVKMGTDRFAATLKGTEVNGSRRAIEDGQSLELAGEVTVVRHDSTYTISRPIGDIVHINMQGDHVDVSVHIGATNAGSVRGLLAGNPADEKHPLVGRDKKQVKGTITKVVLQNFVESWRVEPKESLFSNEDRPKPSGPVEGLTNEQLDKAKTQQARKTCMDRGVTEETALEDCILDVSVMDKPELADAFLFAPQPTLVIHER
jgi:hypothetical protein